MVNQALGKSVVCMKSYCDLQDVDKLEGNLFARQRGRIIDVFQADSPYRESYDE